MDLCLLTNRYQRVVIENASSNYTALTSGVPQGTVLGPTLFLIYMNDVTDKINYSMIRLFADDITIYREVETTNDTGLLQKELKALQHWELVWLLNFNISNCHVLRISRAVKHKVILITNSMMHHYLQLIIVYTYLRITIQSDLKWSTHIHNIVDEASCTFHF